MTATFAPWPAAAVALFLLGPAARAADDGCQALVAAAANGVAQGLKADDQTIHQPDSVTKFTCLGNFFNGVGLNVLTDLNPASIAQQVAGKICTALTDEWNSVTGVANCGLSITGINTNFGLGMGGGTFCPAISFGGGGGNLISATTNTSGSQNWDVVGGTQLPTGYSLDLLGKNTGLTQGPQ